MQESQIPSQKRVSPCGKIIMIIENDTKLSVLHDYLLDEKGKCIDLMVKLQKEEVEMRDKHKELDEQANEELEQV
jgi:hypothetical protein